MGTHTGSQRGNAVAPEAEVVGWRREQLLAAAFPAGLAEALAGDWRYDLHALIELVERGCRPTLAARILAPLDPPPSSPRTQRRQPNRR
jgi:hypothetical protein